ncbi:MAG: hypothetical protein RLZZ196_522 [Bacteroidota bacterium]|jgi:hypothetical protein
MQALKHVGRIRASGKKVLVAYRTLPGDAYSCLVVPTENLPDDMHNSIINLVEGPMAQAAYEFAEALDRSFFPDGSRMLPALHSKGRLIKVGTSDVEMIPTTSSSILLSELNQIIAEQRGVTVDSLAIAEPEKQADVKEVASVNEVAPSENAPTTVNQVEDLSTPEAQAKKFRSEADRLSKQAAELRRQAEALVPTVKKQTKVEA